MENKKQVMEKRNVLGYKENKEHINIFVSKKLKLRTIHKHIKDKNSDWKETDLIPNKIKTGIFSTKKTKVIEIGEIFAQVNRNKYRPLKGGCEISILGARFYGTAGAIVKFDSYNKTNLIGPLKYFVRLLRRVGIKLFEKKGIITNCHVAQKDVSNIKEQLIIQPGIRGNYIGKTVLSIPIKEGEFNKVDVSIIEIDKYVDAEQENIKVGKITGWREPKEKEEVHKYGRTTNYTTGNLIDRGLIFNINYGKGKKMLFKGIDLYSRMSTSGDSGSIVVAKSDNKAVGHLFAGNSKFTMVIPMKSVVKETGIRFT